MPIFKVLKIRSIIGRQQTIWNLCRTMPHRESEHKMSIISNPLWVLCSMASKHLWQTHLKKISWSKMTHTWWQHMRKHHVIRSLLNEVSLISSIAPKLVRQRKELRQEHQLAHLIWDLDLNMIMKGAKDQLDCKQSHIAISSTIHHLLNAVVLPISNKTSSRLWPTNCKM